VGVTLTRARMSAWLVNYAGLCMTLVYLWWIF